MIQTSPLSTTENVKEYTELLLVRYVQPHYSAGALVVHIVFDNPGGLPESPKALEQSRRDSAKLENHQCMLFTSTSSIPEQWEKMLACRTCKSALTSYLGRQFLPLVPNYMNERIPDQEFVTNITETAKSTDIHRQEISRPTFGMLIWLHCVHELAPEYSYLVQTLTYIIRLD